MFTRLIKDESGQGVVEYAGVLAIAGFLALFAYNSSITYIEPAINTALANAKAWLTSS
jgi:Flp pilus assembly pilin Flp